MLTLQQFVIKVYIVRKGSIFIQKGWTHFGGHNYKLSRGEISVANFKAPLQMVQVWTGYNL